MIKIATAECFTHGRIGMEIHAFSRGYFNDYVIDLDPEVYRLSLVASLFIPTLTGVRSILGFEPLKPEETIDDIKVYDQEKDNLMAVKMAEAVRSKTGADIGIGTTAGIGKGAIAVLTNDLKVVASSGMYADLRSSDVHQIMKREDYGVKKALLLLENVLKGEIKADKSEILYF
ncbi:uncharacterized protein (UPF0254 family) [Methanomicrobium sp. W14]|uniref:UPF0254 family protein n=1 Tax=Methanomicrobium sp. W14 TaxID=2817839 RepID=UPI001AE39ED6|nr:UPF0254 family protein [Methanomicrobium sp. W14]MBP2133577.1 uncharacterized protein (UPF0254 family) [Methanomicrobium sp. W14]